ncbi:hypothetical protein [Nocardioides humi]|uniref:hypothetical protein n=1 Tax=Nocardioides humi TaxID=449461 RepID=UPI0011290C11|nr:hypothetical protein [Nocardioides humi]
MRRIALTVTVLLAGGPTFLGTIAPAPAKPAVPTCAGKRATIVDPSKGDDRIVGTNGRDVIVAGRGKGRDVVLGLDGDDLICGNARTKVFGAGGTTSSTAPAARTAAAAPTASTAWASREAARGPTPTGRRWPTAPSTAGPVTTG